MKLSTLIACACFLTPAVTVAQTVNSSVNIQTISSAGAASQPATIWTGAPYTGGSGTTTFPLVLIQPSAATASTTWNTSGTVFGINAHSGGFAKFIDFQIDGVSKASMDVFGTLTLGNAISLGGGAVFLTNGVQFNSSATRTLQFGGPDVASPLTQFLSFSNTLAGTSNVSGAAATITGSLSTGSGTSGDLIFRTGGTGAGATVQNAATAALTIKGATQNVQINAIGSDTGKTDATVCEDTTNHALFSGSGTLGVCLGTSSIRYKHDIAPLTVGLAQIDALKPISYRLNADHGDPRHILYGFTAEDMAPVLPVLVGRDASGRPNTADYLGLVPVLVRAVQEQQAEIEALKTQVGALERPAQAMASR